MSFIFANCVVALALCAAWIDVVTAQNMTFMNGFLNGLAEIGFTNFSAVVEQVTSDGLTAYAQLLSDSSNPVTVFVPVDAAFARPGVNFYGYEYEADSSSFLSSLLLYHLAPGTWVKEDLGANQNHTIISTALHGNNMVLLPNDEAQVIACGLSSNGWEIYNQQITTIVQQTLLYEHVTIQVVNAIIGIPGTITSTMQNFGLTKVQGLMTSLGVGNLGNSPGITVFAAEDAAFGRDSSQIALASPLIMFENHVITGSAILSTMLQESQYTSDSGMNYTFVQDPSDLSWSVTLNGITANIVRTDFLTSNGVMHILDRVLFNSTPPLVGGGSGLVPSQSSPSPSDASTTDASLSTSGAAAPPLPTVVNQPPQPTASNSGTLSSSNPGNHLGVLPIFGIVALSVSILLFPVIGIAAWRARRTARRERDVLKAALDLDERAHSIRPFFGGLDTVTESSESLYRGFQPKRYTPTTTSSGSTGSMVPPSAQYYQLREKAPQPPEAAALRLANSPMRVPVPVLPDPLNLNGTFERIAAQPFVHSPPPPPPPPQSDTLDTASSHRRSGRPPTYCTMPRPSKR